jgi:hypothetical protein
MNNIIQPLVEQAAEKLDLASYNHQLTLQILNVCGFGVAMLLNGLSPSIMPASLGTITDEIDARISPADYAFSIWAVIYSLIFVFVIYQALPGEWVPDRNDKLIFEDIGYWFFVNMLANGVWLILFQTYTNIGFVIALFDAALMLGTNTYIWMLSNRTSVNWAEWIGLRGGFSIYSGWVTAATILNATFMLKQFGVVDPEIPMFNEEQITVGILLVAQVIYNLAAFTEMNPLYGSVFIWVVTAITSNVVENKP